MGGYFRNEPEEHVETFYEEVRLHNLQTACFLARLSFAAGLLLIGYAFLAGESPAAKAVLLAFAALSGLLWLASLDRSPFGSSGKQAWEVFVSGGETILLPLFGVVMAWASGSGMASAFYMAMAILSVGVFFVIRWQSLALLYLAAYGAYLWMGSLAGSLGEDPAGLGAPLAYMAVSFVIAGSLRQRFIDRFATGELLKQRNRELEQLLEDKAAELRDSERHVAYDIIRTMVKIMEHYDVYTKGHSEQVAAIARNIAVEMGMDLETQEEIYLCGLVHDIGKLNVPLDILNKPTGLSKEEQRVMKHHSHMSYELLAESKSLQRIANIVKHHHEHWDGSGYPLGVKHGRIPEESRIIMAADAWDAMRSTRVYRKAMPLAEAVEQLKMHAGTQFDPAVVKAVLRLVEEGRLE